MKRLMTALPFPTQGFMVNDMGGRALSLKSDSADELLFSTSNWRLVWPLLQFLFVTVVLLAGAGFLWREFWSVMTLWNGVLFALCCLAMGVCLSEIGYCIGWLLRGPYCVRFDKQAQTWSAGEFTGSFAEIRDVLAVGITQRVHHVRVKVSLQLADQTLLLGFVPQLGTAESIAKFLGRQLNVAGTLVRMPERSVD